MGSPDYMKDFANYGWQIDWGSAKVEKIQVRADKTNQDELHVLIDSQNLFKVGLYKTANLARKLVGKKPLQLHEKLRYEKISLSELENLQFENLNSKNFRILGAAEDKSSKAFQKKITHAFQGRLNLINTLRNDVVKSKENLLRKIKLESHKKLENEGGIDHNLIAHANTINELFKGYEEEFVSLMNEKNIKKFNQSLIDFQKKTVSILNEYQKIQSLTKTESKENGADNQLQTINKLKNEAQEIIKKIEEENIRLFRGGAVDKDNFDHDFNRKLISITNKAKEFIHQCESEKKKDSPYDLDSLKAQAEELNQSLIEVHSIVSRKIAVAKEGGEIKKTEEPLMEESEQPESIKTVTSNEIPLIFLQEVRPELPKISEPNNLKTDRDFNIIMATLERDAFDIQTKLHEEYQKLYQKYTDNEEQNDLILLNKMWVFDSNIEDYKSEMGRALRGITEGAENEVLDEFRKMFKAMQLDYGHILNLSKAGRKFTAEELKISYMRDTFEALYAQREIQSDSSQPESEKEKL